MFSSCRKFGSRKNKNKTNFSQNKCWKL